MSEEAPDRLLHRERDEARRRLARLEGDVAEIVAASEGSNADDEHDPEGATIAFERSQAGAMVQRTRQRLAEVDAALERWSAGSYGRCVRCGAQIPAGRLEALPATPTCVDCAHERGRES